MHRGFFMFFLLSYYGYKLSVKFLKPLCQQRYKYKCERKYRNYPAIYINAEQFRFWTTRSTTKEKKPENNSSYFFKHTIEDCVHKCCSMSVNKWPRRSVYYSKDSDEQFSTMIQVHQNFQKLKHKWFLNYFKILPFSTICGFILEDLTWSLVTGSVFSLCEVMKDFKTTDFHFQNLGKIS